MSLTNANRSIANILAREVRFRESGRWPSWRWNDVPRGSVGDGWCADVTRVAENGVFCVLVRDAGDGITHLAFRTASNATDITWAEKQRIKDELIGRERLAVEVFPPRSLLVDSANMFHLWVYPVGCKLPFGLREAPE